MTRQELFDAGFSFGKTEGNRQTVFTSMMQSARIAAQVDADLLQSMFFEQNEGSLMPWLNRPADRFIEKRLKVNNALMLAGASFTTNSTRNLEPEGSIVDAILKAKAAMDNARVPVGCRWRYSDGRLEQVYIYPREFYKQQF